MARLKIALSNTKSISRNRNLVRALARTRDVGESIGQQAIAVPMRVLRATNVGSIKAIDALERMGVLKDLQARKIRAGILETDRKDFDAYIKLHQKYNEKKSTRSASPLMRVLSSPKKELGVSLRLAIHDARNNNPRHADRGQKVSDIENRIINRYSTAYRVARHVNALRTLASLTSGGALLLGTRDKKSPSRSGGESSMKKRNRFSK
jgi:hypothetical protein